MLAKELATLDALSEGRLEIGLGSGHVGQEYALAGMSFDSPRVRVDRLIEGIRVIRGLLAPGTFSFTGGVLHGGRNRGVAPTSAKNLTDAHR